MGKWTSGGWEWEEGQGDITREWNGKRWTIATVNGCHLGWHQDGNCHGREAGANAALIAEAGTVANETGLTPRQLAEHRAELLEALQNLCKLADYGEPVPSWASEWDAANAAIAKAVTP